MIIKIAPSFKCFSHQPLSDSDIRIVHLEKSPDGKPCCRIKHVDFDSAKYIALSYSWGSSRDKIEVPVLTGQGATAIELGTLDVTENLYHALEDLLRSDITPKMFWIDQFCVNQHDETDKANHVKRMRYVYPHAQSVVTYMGPDTGRDDVAIALLRKLCSLYITPFEAAYQQDDLWQWLMSLEIQLSEPALQQPELLQFSFPALHTSASAIDSAINQKLQEVLESPLPIDSAWPDLMSILLGDWGQRRWMMQENVLHPRTELLRGSTRLNHRELLILCGVLRFKLYDRRLPTTQSPKTNGSGQLPSEALLTDVQIGKLANASMLYRTLRSRTHEGGKYLHELLHWFRNAITGWPQDQVYALMSFAQDADQLNIAIDYSEEFTRLPEGAKPYIPAKIMTKTSVAALKRHGLSLYLKQREGENKNRPKSMPTWAPIWEMGSPATGLVQPDRNCSNRLGSYVRFEDSDKTLVVKSTMIGTVTQAFGTIRRSCIDHLRLPSPRAAQDNLPQQIVAEVFQSVTTHLEGHGIEDLSYVLGCTYLAGSTWPQRHKNHNRQSCSCENQTLRCEECPQEIRKGYAAAMDILACPADLGSDQNYSLGVEFIRDLGVHGGQLAIVGEDMPCWIPLDAQEGDVVCKLVGGVAAFVLRPLGSKCRDCHYTMVGTAYAPGYMDGEAYKLSHDWDEEAQEIRII